MRFRNEHWPVDGEYTLVFTGLKFTANTASSMSFNNSSVQLMYKINDGSWTLYDTASVTIQLQANDVIYWKRSVSTIRTFQLGKFTMSGNLSVSGNIMSLLDGENFETMTDLTGWGSSSAADGIFANIFAGCSALRNPQTNGIVLPATTLSTGCYYEMFRNCSNLGYAPALPSLTLATSCYQGMFSGTNITTAPDLNATTLSPYCYETMFFDCPNVNYIKCLATNTSETSALNLWTAGVALSGTFIKNASATGWTTGYNGIPSGWTVIEE